MPRLNRPASPSPVREDRLSTLHPIVAAAADGHLPDWAVARAGRRDHMERVATLLDSWAAGLGLSPEERARWRSVGYLHDALRDEAPDALRGLVPEELRSLPGPVLHGPAAAARLRSAGVEDEDLLAAVALHTIGGAELGRLGRALYAADFLEPGRSFLEEWRESLRARMPADLDAVVLELVRARIGHLLERGMSVPWRTVAFWNGLVEEGR